MTHADTTFQERLEQCVQKFGGKRTFAQATGISEAQLFRYLKGDAEPNASKIIKIAEIAQVSPSWLLTEDGTPTQQGKNRLIHTPEYFKAILQTFDEAINELNIEIPLQQRPQILELIYTDTLMEEARREYPFELNHLAMLFKIYFFLSFKGESLQRYRQFMEDDFNHHLNTYSLELEAVTNQICRANTAIYDTPASQFYYDKMGQTVWPPAAKRLDKTLQKAWKILGQKPIKWLDLGCGNGREMSYIHRHYENVSVTGVDNAQYCMDLCEQYTRSDWLPQKSYIKADLRFLPFEANSFDVIYSRQVLECFPYFKGTNLGITQVMQQVYKTLKPKGVFLGVTRYGHSREYARFQQLYNEESMAEIAKKTGLEIIEIKPWNYTKEALKESYINPTKYDNWLSIILQKIA